MVAHAHAHGHRVQVCVKVSGVQSEVVAMSTKLDEQMRQLTALLVRPNADGQKKSAWSFSERFAA